MKKGILVKGYTIRIQRGDAGWKSEKHYCWAPAGEIPAEWQKVQEDETVKSAEVFLSSQRRYKPGKRKITATYQREEPHAS